MKTEKAFDMLPYVAKIYNKLDFKELQKRVKTKDVEKAGIDVFAYIFENSAKVKAEFFSLVAVYTDKTEKEIKEQDFGETMESLKEIFTDIQAMSFFQQAMQ